MYCEAACCGNGFSLKRLVFAIFSFEWEFFDYEDFDSDAHCQVALSLFKAAKKGLCQHLLDEVQRRLADWNYHYWDDIDAEVKNLVERAAQGCSNAQFHVGFCYQWGQGVRRSFTDAAKWVRMASELGSVEAHLQLGKWHHHGRCGMQQSFWTAAKYYLKAAECGAVEGQVLFATLCYEGRTDLSEAESNHEAEKWFLKAAKQHDETAKKFLSRFWWCRYGMADLLESDGIESAVSLSAKESEAMNAAEQGNVDSKKWLSALWRTQHGWTECHETIHGNAEGDAQFTDFTSD